MNMRTAFPTHSRPGLTGLMQWGCVVLVRACFASAVHAEEPFYKAPLLFSQAPNPDKSQQSIGRFGPVGIGIDLLQPAFVMKVSGVEPGSPADGKLKAGQIIETINGAKLRDIDPRIQLGNIITDAEARDGVVKFMVKDSPSAPAQEVVVNIPVLGAYSPTWPLDCPKSDQIVRNEAEFIKTSGNRSGFFDMLFLLSTGDEGDLAYVREWARKQPVTPPNQFHTWIAGLSKLALCEYYLRTGDEQVLPAIQAATDSLLQAENNGAWGNRAPLSGLSYGGGGGHFNASSVHAATFLMLAKQCGAEIPDEQLLRVLANFYRYAGRGNVPYGNNRPEGTYTDNGRNGGLALAMAAAAALDPDGEASVYAGARDISALFAFTSTSFMLHGHTGGGIGEIFRSASMGLLHEKQPHLYREFMNQRRWHYELSRRWDGSMTILGGERYDNHSWGMGYALTYTVPRKKLQLFGAPPSPYAKPFKLPERPWGTAADDDFVSIQAIAYPDGMRPDFSQDTLANGGAMALLEVRRGELSDEQLARFIRHPNIIARNYLMGNITQKGPDYVLALLNDADARMRRLALGCIGGAVEELLTPEVFKRLITIIADPQESWFAQDAALGLIGKAAPDQILPHIDTILAYLGHEEWWLQQSATIALTPVATDASCAKKVLLAIGKMLANNHLISIAGSVRWGGLAGKLREADDEVAALAREALIQAYNGYVAYEHPLPEVANRVNQGMRQSLAAAIANIPGGYDALYTVAKQENPNVVLPYEGLFLDADFDKFGPELRKAVNPIIRDHVISEFIVKNRASLLSIAEGTHQSAYIEKTTAMDDLVDLYRKLDVTDYDWQTFGTDLKTVKWDYLTFDPPEQLALDRSVWQYREVTMPAGTEEWFKPDFDPVAAGWKQGFAPFGQYDGKLVRDAEGALFKTTCPHPYRTFWDKQVLLLRGTVDLPALKPGHLYRLKVNYGNGVGNGDGYRIYINGKQLIEVVAGIPRRAGGRERGAFITKEFFDEFGKGPVTFAAISFLRYGDKAIVTMPPVPQGSFCLEVEEMQVPPLDAATFQKAAAFIGMRSAAWQAMQDPDDTDRTLEDGLFRYDGKFVPNAQVPGNWTAVTLVATPEEFNSSQKANRKGIPFREITFKDGGFTNTTAYFWSGDTLMDLNKRQMLKITPRTIDGSDYLFIEAGGFSEKNPPTWQSPLMVLKRAVL